MKESFICENKTFNDLNFNRNFELQNPTKHGVILFDFTYVSILLSNMPLCLAKFGLKGQFNIYWFNANIFLIQIE